VDRTDRRRGLPTSVSCAALGERRDEETGEDGREGRELDWMKSVQGARVPLCGVRHGCGCGAAEARHLIDYLLTVPSVPVRTFAPGGS
jgi:hypothetical protein